MLTVTDAEKHTVEYQYDAMNRRTRATDANGRTVRTDYDQAGRAIAVTNGAGETTATACDALGRPLSVTDAQGFITEFRYDANGNLTCVIDANASAGLQLKNADGCTVSTQYDELDRAVLTRDALDGVTRIAYDLPGNPVERIDAEGRRYTWAYDGLGRLVSETDFAGALTRYQRDQAGNLLTKTTYQGSTTRYTYDGAGTLVAISNPDYLTVNYQYDAAGRLLSRVMSSGARSLYGYDDGGRLASLAHQDGVGATVTEQAYSRDRVGNITAITATAGPVTGTTHYTLDALYRLTQVDAPGTANDEAFAYDRLGNRLTATRGGITIGAAGSTTKYSIYTTATQTGSVSGYTPAYNHRLKEIRIGSVVGAIDSSFAFDQEGRMTGQTGSTPRTLTWDAKSRLKSLNGETYAYDPSDHRVGRSGGICVRAPWRSGRILRPDPEEFLDQEILQFLLVFRSCRQHDGAAQAQRFPVEVAAVVTPYQFDHALYDGAFDVAVQAGVDLDEFAPGVAGVGGPAAEHEGGGAHALAGDLEHAVGARLLQVALDVGGGDLVRRGAAFPCPRGGVLGGRRFFCQAASFALRRDEGGHVGGRVGCCRRFRRWRRGRGFRYRNPGDPRLGGYRRVAAHGFALLPCRLFRCRCRRGHGRRRLGGGPAWRIGRDHAHADRLVGAQRLFRFGFRSHHPPQRQRVHEQRERERDQSARTDADMQAGVAQRAGFHAHREGREAVGPAAVARMFGVSGVHGLFRRVRTGVVSAGTGRRRRPPR
ncbi:hypothetical protein [Methyloversatilis sp.]|uniref:hypothetical protein n=1 Tax=Methyloversatilis sp. TaxID=2569862 RepID=UPI0035B3A47A